MKKIVLVDTLSQFLVRYAVEVEDDETHALDEVVSMEDNTNFKEFSQKHLGTTIVSSRVVSEKEMLDMFDADNAYLKSWDSEKKLSYVNKIDYGEDM